MSNKDKIEFKVTKKDFELTWFSGTGAGGQHKNKHMNSCRIKHKDTGIIKTGQSNRNRESNKREAMRAMVKDPRFMSYCEMKLRELERGITIEELVDEMMTDENLKIEVRENGKWIEKNV